jgi:WD40 repeat protein
VFAPDGGRIPTAGDNGCGTATASRSPPSRATRTGSTARLWDRDAKPLATLQGHTGPVNTAVFAPGAEPRGSRVVLPPLWHWDGSKDGLAAWRSAMEGTGRFQLCRTTEIALGDDLYEGWWRSQPTRWAGMRLRSALFSSIRLINGCTALTELAIQSVLPR